MNCPVCKCPNSPGATHCNQCYEVFNRSAAQAYLQSVRRERRQREGDPEEPEVTIQSQRFVDEEAKWQKLDVNKTFHQGMGMVKRYWVWPVVLVALIGGWMALSFLVSAELWYSLMGKKLHYFYPEKTALTYLVGMKQNTKIWSERDGRLDTPIEKRYTDEMGTVSIEKVPGKKNFSAKASAKEWIQILNEEAGSSSRSIPKKHPTLSGGRIIFDKTGMVLERRVSYSPRLGKSLTFIAPKFPKGAQKAGDTWNESIEWLDDYSGWKIAWRGKLQWSMGGIFPCQGKHCAQLLSVGDLRPVLRGVPDWARGITKKIDGKASATGRAQFDSSRKQLAANFLSYEGLVRIPITKLQNIPMDLRVGRRVKGPGEIVIYLDNKIEIRKN